MHTRHRALSACLLLLVAMVALQTSVVATGATTCETPRSAGTACPAPPPAHQGSPGGAPGPGNLPAQTTDPSPEPDPDIFVDTADIEYGTLAVGESATANVTVRNDGEGPLRVKDIVVRGDAFSLALMATDTDGTLDTEPLFTLESNESRTVPVVFEPAAAGSYSTVLSIEADDPETPTTNVSLSGAADPEPTPALSVSRQTLTFDNATVGETSVRNVTVSNDGDADLQIRNQTIQPGDRGFEIQSPVGETLAPGASETLSVSFLPDSRNATSAALSLTTDGGTAVVSLSSSRANANVSVNRSDNVTRVTASVENATAGEVVDISVPPDPDDLDSTDIDSVSITPAENASFDVNVTSTGEPPETAATFEPTDSTEPAQLGYLNITHTIPNGNISEATVQYRVNRTTMDDLEAEPEDFTLYRRTNGTWVATNTSLRRETNRSFVFRSTVTGLSEWTAATEVPSISVSDAEANVTAITTADEVEIQVLLNNTGGSDGRFEVQLLLNGSVVERRDVAVSPETTSLVTFQRGFDRPGTYGITVNDVFVAAIDVADGEANVVEGGPSPTATPVELTTGSGGPWGALAAGGVGILAVVGLLGYGIYRFTGSDTDDTDAAAEVAADSDGTERADDARATDADAENESGDEGTE